MMVVLPVPGPPVMISTLFRKDMVTASACWGAKVRPRRCCTHSKALAGSTNGRFCWACSSILSRLAALVSAR